MSYMQTIMLKHMHLLNRDKRYGPYGFINVGGSILGSTLITPQRFLIPIRVSLLVCKHTSLETDS